MSRDCASAGAVASWRRPPPAGTETAASPGCRRHPRTRARCSPRLRATRQVVSLWLRMFMVRRGRVSRHEERTRPDRDPDHVHPHDRSAILHERAGSFCMRSRGREHQISHSRRISEPPIGASIDEHWESFVGSGAVVRHFALNLVRQATDKRPIKRTAQPSVLGISAPNSWPHSWLLFAIELDSLLKEKTCEIGFDLRC
jgi:hypothetical protein